MHISTQNLWSYWGSSRCCFGERASASVGTSQFSTDFVGESNEFRRLIRIKLENSSKVFQKFLKIRTSLTGGINFKLQFLSKWGVVAWIASQVFHLKNKFNIFQESRLSSNAFFLGCSRLQMKMHRVRRNREDVVRVGDRMCRWNWLEHMFLVFLRSLQKYKIKWNTRNYIIWTTFNFNCSRS